VGVAARAAEAPTLRLHAVRVLVDRLDLATARAIQFARTLHPDDLRAVHFVLDSRRAELLSERWTRLGLSRLPLELIECPDRRLPRAALELAAEAAADGQTEVSLLLPRRAYGRVWSRFLHDQTADRIVVAVSQLEHVTATIVPFEVRKALAERHHEAHVPAPGPVLSPADHAVRAMVGEPDPAERLAVERDEALAAVDGGGLTLISQLRQRQTAKVAGRVRSVRVQPLAGVPTLECTLTDSTGRLLVTFLGRRRVPGVEPGTRLVVEGMVGTHRGQPTILNPIYEIVAPAEGE